MQRGRADDRPGGIGGLFTRLKLALFPVSEFADDDDGKKGDDAAFVYLPAGTRETGEQRAKRAVRRFQVVNEILETEASYVEALDLLLYFYITPLKKMALHHEYLTREARATKTWRAKLISPEEYLAVSSNLETLVTLHREFLAELRAKSTTWNSDDVSAQEIAEVFNKYAKFLPIYTSYVTGYNQRVLPLLQQFLANPKFAQWHDETKDALIVHLRSKGDSQQPTTTNSGDPSRVRANTSGEGLDMNSYLIMPIQRIPRYRLLLRELLKVTCETESEFSRLVSALHSVQQVARTINESVREEENRRQMVALGNSITIPSGKPPLEIVSPGRSFVRQGYLTKRGTASSERFVFFLFNDLLLWSTQSGAEKYVAQGWITITDETSVLDVPDEHDSVLQNPSKSGAGQNYVVTASGHNRIYVQAEGGPPLELTCASPSEKQSWLRDISQCIEDSAAKESEETKQEESKLDFERLTPESTCCCCGNVLAKKRDRNHCQSCKKGVCANCSTSWITVPLHRSREAQRVCDDCFATLKREALYGGLNQQVGALEKRESSRHSTSASSKHVSFSEPSRTANSESGTLEPANRDGNWDGGRVCRQCSNVCLLC